MSLEACWGCVLTLSWIDEKALRTHPLAEPTSSKVFVMLVAYMDDSGTHDGSHNSVLAGYWGSRNEWGRFERAWKAVLDSEGIEEFHANRFWPRIDGERLAPFKGWDDRRHARFIDNLLNVIQATRVYPFACGIFPGEWDKLSEERMRLYAMAEKKNKKQQKPLILPLHRIVVRIASYAHSHKVVHFVMDLNKGNSAVQQGMLSAFAEYKRQLELTNDPLVQRIGSLSFEDSVKARPIQAADLLAYEAHRYAKGASRNKNSPMRIEYIRALARFRSREDFWLFDDVRMGNLNRVVEEAVQRRQEPKA